ncbi:uncharacterized protein LOC125044851 [Penaeus chinensis]|uniref:uncharacterized protein LOC125044851 n=1 Tax=Penaeus chinensis TaxID=139456 RepID=UPI001FB7074B|nr:uncharacterized protein LOC125044851 [Penaeus chinensis]
MRTETNLLVSGSLIKWDAVELCEMHFDSSISYKFLRMSYIVLVYFGNLPHVYFDNRTLFANVTSNRPNFNVSRLDAGTSYQIKVYVSHGPVTSQPVVVSAYTSRTSRTAPGDTSTSEGGVSVGGVVGGLAVTLVLLVGVVVMRNYCRRRRGRRKQEPRPQSDDSNPDVVPNIEETYDLLAPGEPKAEASYDSMNTPMPEDVPMVSRG